MHSDETPEGVMSPAAPTEAPKGQAPDLSDSIVKYPANQSHSIAILDPFATGEVEAPKAEPVAPDDLDEYRKAEPSSPQGTEEPKSKFQSIFNPLFCDKCGEKKFAHKGRALYCPEPSERTMTFTPMENSWQQRAEAAESRVTELGMVLDLVATDEVFLERAEGGGWTFCVNVNDMFYPAADGEGVDISEIPAVWKAWKESGWTGVARWVQEKRGGLKLRKSREEKILSIERLQERVTELEGRLEELAGG